METRTSQISIFDNEKQLFCDLCKHIFHVWIFAQTFLFFPRCEMACFAVVSVWWQMLNFVFIHLKCCFQFNSSRVRIHFASVQWLWIIKKRLEKREVTLSDDVLFPRCEMAFFAVVSVWWQMLNFVFLHLKCCFQFNSSRVRIHFASVQWPWIM